MYVFVCEYMFMWGMCMCVWGCVCDIYIFVCMWVYMLVWGCVCVCVFWGNIDFYLGYVKYEMVLEIEMRWLNIRGKLGLGMLREEK